MENKVKGSKYDVGNTGGDFKYCCDNYQYHHHYDEYHTNHQSK